MSKGAKQSSLRFFSFPRTVPPPKFIDPVMQVFATHEAKISTPGLTKGLTSDGVLKVLAADLAKLGWQTENGKRVGQKIPRPVFFGENGKPSLNYQVDAYQPEWKCGLEIEAGRAWMGNAVYRDLIQAMVMVNVEHLILAVPLEYKYLSGQKPVVSHDYENTLAVAESLFGHSRIKMPYGLTLIGY